MSDVELGLAADLQAVKDTGEAALLRIHQVDESFPELSCLLSNNEYY